MAKNRTNNMQAAQTALYEVLAKYPGEEAFSAEATTAMMQVFQQYPILQQDANFAKLQTRISQIQPGTTAAGQLMADVYDIVVSSKDVKLSDKQLKALKPPALPASPDARRIDERLASARLRESTAGATESAINQRIVDDQYAQDLANAQTASTGQAASYGSMAQAASNRRARNRLLGRAGERQAVNEQSARVDALTQERQRAAEQKFLNDYRNTMLLESRYNTDRKYADDLGRRGRQSRRNAIHNIVDPLSTLASTGIAQYQMNGGGGAGSPTQEQIDAAAGGAATNEAKANAEAAFADLRALNTIQPPSMMDGIAPEPMVSDWTQIREYNPDAYDGYESPEDATAALQTKNDAYNFNQGGGVGRWSPMPINSGVGRFGGLTAEHYPPVGYGVSTEPVEGAIDWGAGTMNSLNNGTPYDPTYGGSVTTLDQYQNQRSAQGRARANMYRSNPKPRR